MAEPERSLYHLSCEIDESLVWGPAGFGWCPGVTMVASSGAFHVTRGCLGVDSWLAMVEESDSEDEIRQQVLRYDPQLVIAAHNGFRFDFPMLLSECFRNKGSVD